MHPPRWRHRDESRSQFSSTNSKTKAPLKYLLINARSLKSQHKQGNEISNNIARFQDLVYSEDNDIICVTETWLKSDISNSEILNEGYVPHTQTKHGLTEFSNLLADIRNNYDDVILAGDFNLPNINWHSDTDVTNEGTSCEFLEILKDYYLTQVNSIPTRGNNVLDLIITSFPDKVKVRETLSPEISGIVTDYDIISFEIDIKPARPPKTMRVIYDYKNANFKRLRAAFASSNLCDLVSEMDGINDAWIVWKNSFLRTVTDYVPMKKVKTRRNVPWLTSEIRHFVEDTGNCASQISTVSFRLSASKV